MTVRAVIFDLGHTLWDILPDDGGLAEAYSVMRRTLAERLSAEVPSAETLRRAVADVLRAASETYFMDGDHLDQPASHTWIDAACRKLGLELGEPLLREITPPLFATERTRHSDGDSIAAVFDLHERGYALGCVTNTLADTAAIRAMLRRHGIEQVMRSVVVSADEGWRKPHRSLFEKALRETGAAPHEAVFVGDSPLHDIGGAQAAGMRAILTTQYAARPTAGLPTADAVIAHLRELRPIIEGW
jgi:putative hydrolase of the HAD superfamily